MIMSWLTDYASLITFAFRGQPEPLGPFAVILSHAAARHVHDAERVLSEKVALLGRMAKPSGGGSFVEGHALAGGVRQAKIMLCCRFALFSGQA